MHGKDYPRILEKYCGFMKDGNPIPCDNEVEKQMRGVSYNAKAIFFPQSRPQRTFHGGQFIFHVSDPRHLYDPDWLYSSYDERGVLAGLPGGRLSDIRTLHRKYDYRPCGRAAAPDLRERKVPLVF